MSGTRRDFLNFVASTIPSLGIAAGPDDEGTQTEETERPGYGEAYGQNYGGEQTPSECFIATAATHPEAPPVYELRRFRDDVLAASRLGRAFIRVYYATSPPIARWIRRGSTRRWLVRRALVHPAARLASTLTQET